MRSLGTLFALLLIAGFAQADVLYTFSGTWGSRFGVVTAGDAFSATATWNPADMGMDPLTSFSYSAPASEGLSVASILSPQYLYGVANDTISPFVLQIGLQSTVDDNIYVLFLGPFGGAISNSSFTQDAIASNYTVIGPVNVPEPAASALVCAGLVCGLFALRSRAKRIIPAG